MKGAPYPICPACGENMAGPKVPQEAELITACPACKKAVRVTRRVVVTYDTELLPPEQEAKVVYKHELYNADPKCEHIVIDAPGGGVKCTRCEGWFCY